MGSLKQYWDTLAARHRDTADRSILSLFHEPGREKEFSAQTGDMLFDYSKTNIDVETRRALIDLLDAADVAGKRA
ncbi:MAG: glucose-6-phosphate isomerase, partial [Pseudomonadota bacterium]